VPDEPTCVIYNPAAGRGRAKKLIDDARRRLAPDAELLPTEGPGHAAEVATAAVARGVRRVVAAGGDGTVHEVANGLLDANDPAAVLSVWPLGSMNDYAFTLGVGQWWGLAERPPLDRMAVDVGRATGGGRSKWFINSAGVGFNGMVTIESRTVKWLRGVPLYAWGLAKAMVKHFAAPPLTVTVGDHRTVGPVLLLGLYLGQREGGFPIGKDARLDDGLFDTFLAADVARWELVRHFPGLMGGNLPHDHPKLTFGRGATVTVSGPVSLCCHLDGEFLCRPEDGATDLRFEVVPRRLTVECHRAGLYGRPAAA
jgi:diacylglycerol kinase (ATP)